MKRICLLGAAIAGLFTIGVTNALAVGSHAPARTAASKTKAKGKSKASGTFVHCKLTIALQTPSGSPAPTPASQSGNHAGTVACPVKKISLGRGAELDSFTTDAGGDLIGKWQQWFNTGSVYGTYDLAPNDSGPTSSFTASSYTGTFVVKGGTGTLAKATGKGTMSCSSPDSIHFSCKSNGRVAFPTTATTKH